MHYAIAPWREITDPATGGPLHVAPGAGNRGVFDLGSHTGTHLGFFSNLVALGGDALYLGDNLGAMPDKAAIQSLLQLGEPIVADTLAGAIVELSTVAADPTGVARGKPLRPTRSGFLEMYFGPVAVRRRFLGAADPAWVPIRNSIQLDVKQVRADVLAGKLPVGQHLRYLAVLARKHSRPYTDFLAPGEPDEGTIEPATVITDGFTTTTTWTDLAGDLQIVTNHGESNLTDGTTWFGQHTSSLSTDDMYAQVAATLTSGTGTRNVGACARIYDNAGSIDRYWGRCDFNTGPVFDFKCDKRVSGVSSTIIASNTATYSAGALIKVQADGSTIRVWYNGAENSNSPVTDTGISGILTAGATLRYPAAGTSSHAQADNFEAADLVTVGVGLTDSLRLNRTRLVA